MPSYFQAVVLGLLQGLSELFPVSSLGHSVILPSLLQWQIDQASTDFLPFLVATHAATALALLAFFRRDWAKILKGMWRSVSGGMTDVYGRLGWLLVIGTIPAGAIGFLLQKKLELLFANAELVAVLLMLNGLILLLADRIKARMPKKTESSVQADAAAARLSIKQAFGVGLAQAAALLPGISRSGSAMAGGLFVGLTHEEAARFSFLLATPIIAAAAVLKLPVFLHAGSAVVGPALAGAIAAALAAWFSVKFLTRYFQSNRLSPFGWYCLVAGAGAFLILALS